MTFVPTFPILVYKMSFNFGMDYTFTEKRSRKGTVCTSKCTKPLQWKDVGNVWCSQIDGWASV